MFSLHDFIRKGFLNAVGKMADYQIILNAAGWYDKGVLLEEDLAEIQAAIDARNAAQVSDALPSEDAPSGETAEETPSGEESPTEETPSGEESPVEETPSGEESPTEETPSGEESPTEDSPSV